MPTVKHGSIMLLGCVAAGGTGHIVQVEGRMDSTKYQEDNVQRSVQTLKLKRGWVQQDNDPKHTSKSPMKYLQDRQMKVLEWSPQSPDTENLWRDLNMPYMQGGQRMWKNPKSEN